jgi:hypothetical protein
MCKIAANYFSAIFGARVRGQIALADYTVRAGVIHRVFRNFIDLGLPVVAIMARAQHRRRSACRPHLAETMACSTFIDGPGQTIGEMVNDLNVQNRGDYFSAIFGLALGGRPRLTSTRYPRKAARRYSRPPCMPAFFAAPSRPRRVGNLPAACSELM